MQADASKNRFRIERERLGWTQAQLAEKLKCAPRTVTALEAPGAESGRAYKKYLQRLHQILSERSLNPPETDSDKYRFSQDVFDLLIARRVYPNRADRVLVEADFFPLYQALPEDPPGAPLFAKHYMRVIYENLLTEDSEGLVADAVGNPDGPIVKGERRRAMLHVRLVPQAQEKETNKWVEKEIDLAQYQRLLIEKQERFIRTGSFGFFNSGSPYDNIICYELRVPEPINTPRIELLYFANHACRLGAKEEDAVGFALPVDTLIGSISIRATFHEGLLPVPEAFSYPLRIMRHAKAARPIRYSSKHVPKPSTAGPHDDKVTYTFSLDRPKPGWGYIISWPGLVWNPTKAIQPSPNFTVVDGEDWNQSQPT